MDPTDVAEEEQEEEEAVVDKDVRPARVPRRYQHTLDPTDVAEEEMVDKDIRTIEIIFGKLTDLRTVYKHPEMTLKVEFLGETVLESVPMRYDETEDIGESLSITLDLLNYHSIDRMISNPLVVVLTETDGEPDGSINLPPPERSGKAQWRSEESALDLEEALLGTRYEPEKTIDRRKSSGTSKRGGSKTSSKDKETVGGRSSKGSKGSKLAHGSSSKQIPAPPALPKPTGPQSAGVGMLDLLPLFSGEEGFSETIVLYGETAVPLDDRIRAIARLPKIDITVTIDSPIPSGCLYNITVESIFNLPAVMSENMAYEMVLHIPAGFNCIIPFYKYTYATTQRQPFINKKWYGTNRDTNYYIEGNLEHVKSCFCARASDVMSKDVPRIDYNVLKRNYASEEDIEVLKLHIKNYRCIVGEIYMHRPEAAKNLDSPKQKRDSKKSLEDKDTKKGKAVDIGTDTGNDVLHLMVYVDMCRLLYPGQKNVRVAAALRTFHMDEAETNGGLKDSHFCPRPVPAEPAHVEEKKHKTKAKEKSGKESSSKKGSSSKKESSKKDSSKSGKGKLAGKLPSAPVPPEPSRLIYNEDGMPTFILMQFEFKEPVVRAREMEDLAEDLNHIIFGDSEVQNLPKTVNSELVTEKLYKDSLKTICQDLKVKYLDYQEQDESEDFLTYIQATGVYQTYLSTITRAVATYVNAVTDYNAAFTKGDYQIFISQIYVKLVEKMNTTINEIFMAGVSPSRTVISFSDKLLRYGYEAMELNLTNLANRYFLQRICDDETNADFWFDYAVFNMHIDEKEKAIECAKEALRHVPTHRNSLVLYALALSNRKKYIEAETCLLSVTLHDPAWMEGWGALYCVYFKKNNREGMEVCMEVAEKNLEVQPAQECRDNAWTSALVPNTFFYRTACYFISLRFFEEAQIMLANEVIKAQDAINEYLLAVISYYKTDYDHAILHIDNAMNYGGCDYTKCSLRGHIFASKSINKCAIDEYKKIFKLYEQPSEDYVYFVYVRSGMCYSQLMENQQSRVAFLQACKLNGTPFTWLCAGVLFYHQKDFLSAEDCLTQSNTLDNRLPETWAYLAMVNVKLKKAHEASMCLNQAERHKLENQELLEFARSEVQNLLHVFESL